MDPEMVLALQEVDALTPETPPLAPVQGPEPNPLLALVAAYAAQAEGMENSLPRRSVWDNPEQMANVAGRMVTREAYDLGRLNAVCVGQTFVFRG